MPTFQYRGRQVEYDDPNASQTPAAPTMPSFAPTPTSGESYRVNMPGLDPGATIPPPWAATPGVNPWSGLPGNSPAQNPGKFEIPNEWNYQNGGQQHATTGPSFEQGWLSSGGKTTQDLLNYFNANPYLAQQGYSLGGSKGDKVFQNGQFVADAVLAAGEGGRGAQWLRETGGGASGGGGGTSGQVFNDPATAQWEQLLRQISDRLLKPQPEYTPAQLELLQTQAIDPMTRQRDQARQQTIQRFASRGIGPGSGILEQALLDIDKQFNQAQTQQQTAFTAQNIARGDQRFAGDEARALQSLGLMGQIPQLADSRLQLAQGGMINPFGAMGTMSSLYNTSFQNQMYQQQQTQQYWNYIAQLLSQALGAF